eukprot:ANDGO_04677.mRNA.1 hypothetical protein
MYGNAENGSSPQPGDDVGNFVLWNVIHGSGTGGDGQDSVNLDAYQQYLWQLPVPDLRVPTPGPPREHAVQSHPHTPPHSYAQEQLWADRHVLDFNYSGYFQVPTMLPPVKITDAEIDTVERMIAQRTSPTAAASATSATQGCPSSAGVAAPSSQQAHSFFFPDPLPPPTLPPFGRHSSCPTLAHTLDYSAQFATLDRSASSGSVLASFAAGAATAIAAAVATAATEGPSHGAPSTVSGASQIGDAPFCSISHPFSTCLQHAGLILETSPRDRHDLGWCVLRGVPTPAAASSSFCVLHTRAAVRTGRSDYRPWYGHLQNVMFFKTSTYVLAIQCRIVRSTVVALAVSPLDLLPVCPDLSLRDVTTMHVKIELVTHLAEAVSLDEVVHHGKSSGDYFDAEEAVLSSAAAGSAPQPAPTLSEAGTEPSFLADDLVVVPNGLEATRLGSQGIECRVTEMAAASAVEAADKCVVLNIGSFRFCATSFSCARKVLRYRLRISLFSGPNDSHTVPFSQIVSPPFLIRAKKQSRGLAQPADSFAACSSFCSFSD